MRLLHRIQPDSSFRQGIMPIRRGNGGVLPIERQAVGAGRCPVGAGHDVRAGQGAGGGRDGIRDAIGSSPGSDGLADAVAVGIFSNHRPAVIKPGHRLEMDDASVSSLVLEMEEPAFTGGRFHPTALVRAVDRARGGCHHDAFFIGAERMAGAQHGLPAGLDAAGRSENIIISVPLVELRPFNRGLRAVPVIDDARRAQQTRPVGTHRSHEHYAFKAGAGAGRCVRQPGAAVFVPERAGIDEAFGADHPDGIFPTAARILRPDHEYTPVGIAAEDVEPAVVIAD